MGFWRDRNVFVTGATGLLGSWMVEELVARDMGWTVVDFRTASLRRKDVIVTPLRPAVECSINAFFSRNHSPTLLARRMSETVKAVLTEGL